ncbi:semaphorin-6A-like, partial [Anneissia japonica]|uniref:semaphorin-6A-like n=1 Tax=Anneissia japonica TaxID=1529436 RepID=UPI001425B28A
MPASAVCRFDLDHIRDNFDNGLLKLTKCPWSPIADSQRGGCSASDSRRLSHDNLNFIKSHPLMHEPIVGEDRSSKPVSYTHLVTLVRKRYRLKTLVVRTSQHHTVVFAGTDDGRVLKLVERRESPSVLLYNVRVIGQPITNMRLYESRNVIFVTSKDFLVEMSTQHCSQLKNCSCKQEPIAVLIDGNCTESTDKDHSDVELDCNDSIEHHDCKKQIEYRSGVKLESGLEPGLEPGLESGLKSGLHSSYNVAETEDSTPKLAVLALVGEQTNGRQTRPAGNRVQMVTVSRVLSDSDHRRSSVSGRQLDDSCIEGDHGSGVPRSLRNHEGRQAPHHQQ